MQKLIYKHQFFIKKHLLPMFKCGLLIPSVTQMTVTIAQKIKLTHTTITHMPVTHTSVFIGVTACEHLHKRWQE